MTAGGTSPRKRVGRRPGPWTVETRQPTNSWTRVVEGVDEDRVDAAVEECRAGSWYSYRIVPRTPGPAGAPVAQ